jgi:hypothetical protein
MFFHKLGIVTFQVVKTLKGYVKLLYRFILTRKSN